MVCSICLELIDKNYLCTICNHNFHEECLGLWALRSNLCPLCRCYQSLSVLKTCISKIDLIKHIDMAKDRKIIRTTNKYLIINTKRINSLTTILPYIKTYGVKLETHNRIVESIFKFKSLPNHHLIKIGSYDLAFQLPTLKFRFSIINLKDIIVRLTDELVYMLNQLNTVLLKTPTILKKDIMLVSNTSSIIKRDITEFGYGNKINVTVKPILREYLYKGDLNYYIQYTIIEGIIF